MRSENQIVLVDIADTAIDGDQLEVVAPGEEVQVFHIDDWRAACDSAKAIATKLGLRWDVTLQARNELNMS